MKGKLTGLLIFCMLIVTISVPGIADSQRDDLLVVKSNHENNLFSYATPESQGLSPESLERLMDEIRRYLKEGEVVGAEVAIIKGDKVVLHEALGWRDREKEIQMENNTLFNVRSMTKTLTGAAIQLLADRGELSLEDKVAKYIPGFDNEKSKSITIEQLLEHRGGLPLTILTSTDEYENLYALANEIGERGPDFKPGEKFWYSDAGANVLAAVVEVVAKVPIDEFIVENILEPLAMDDSFYYSELTRSDQRKNRIASLYGGGKGGWVKFWSPEKTFYPFPWGSQGLYSTPLDYARFLYMLMNVGQLDRDQLLSPEAKVRMLTPSSRMKVLGSDILMPTGFYNSNVFYGQMITLYAREDSIAKARPNVFGHSGSDGTWAWAWPERDLLILYFTQSRGNLTGLTFESLIDEQLIHPELATLNAEARQKYSSYIGKYFERTGEYSYGEFEVFVQNGEMVVKLPMGLVSQLDPPDELGWRNLSSVSGLSVLFEDNDERQVVEMKFREGSKIHELTRKSPDEEKKLELEDVEKYLGYYRDEESGFDIEVIFSNGHLGFVVPEVAVPLELYPPDSEGWWALRLNPSVRVKFNLSETGEVVSYTAKGPEGENVNKRVD